MDIDRCKLAIVSLFMITICFWLLPLSIYAGSRGMVINDLNHQSDKLGAYRALIIGINDYRDPKIQDLETAVNDATAMAKLLRERYGFQVKLLLDRKATKEAIYQALRNLALSTKSDDSVLIYYAGHGDLDRTYNDGWWIPVDAKGGKPLTYLDNVQVQKAMRSMNARHVLLISDSCYSGTLFGQARAMPSVIDEKYYLALYNEKSRWGMTSGNKTPVSDRGAGGHSVFAYQLLKELKKNDKPHVSIQEIYTRIAPIIGNNSEQTPLCRPIRNAGDQGGEFIFVSSNDSKDIAVDARLLAERRSLEQERVELERIKMEIERKKLGAERKQIEEEKKKHQLYLSNIDNSTGQATQNSEVYPPYSLAIFPFKIVNGFAYESEIISGLEEALTNSKLFSPIFSYYTLSRRVKTQNLDRKYLPPDVVNNLMVKKSYFGNYKPNVELICKLGRKLNVDFILFYYLEVSISVNDVPDQIEVFLINITTKRLYAEKHNFLATWESAVDPSTKMITETVFNYLARDKPLQ
jgi:hypothetical protein